MRRSPRRLATLWLASCLPVAQAALAAGGEIGPGSYCPLPAKGEVPKCLDPAQKAYGAFFTALDAENPDPGSLAAVEAAVGRGARAEDAYLALSSLAYGYYRLAVRTAGEPQANPAVVARLSRWNDLLANAYAASPDDERYREAVRTAARELQVKAPVALPCRDARGEPAACSSTEAVLRGFQVADDEVGLRGALERAVRRLFGLEASP